MKNNIVITGVPRGGTTLYGYLMNNLENAYCFSEPSAVNKFLNDSSCDQDFFKKIDSFFKEERSHIISNGCAFNRLTPEGNPVSNYYRRSDEGNMIYWYKESVEEVSVNNDFLLGVKHNAHFLSILPLLCESADLLVVAVIRHPISTILSWRSLDLPISHGRLPAGEKFWLELAKITQSSLDLMLKQVLIYETIVSRILACRRQVHIQFYEQLVRHPNECEKFFSRKFTRSIKIENMNKNCKYDWREEKKIKQLITIHAKNTLTLYPDLDDYGY